MTSTARRNLYPSFSFGDRVGLGANAVQRPEQPWSSRCSRQIAGGSDLLGRLPTPITRRIVEAHPQMPSDDSTVPVTLT